MYKPPSTLQPSTLKPDLNFVWLLLLMVSILFSGVSTKFFFRFGELNGSLMIFSLFSVGCEEDLGLPICPVLRESRLQMSDTLTYW